MADVRGSTGHDSHDLELIAGLAAGDLTGSEATRAGQLAASCADCAEIMSDLRAIATATRTMPSAFDPGTAPAPRDYRLTAASRLSFSFQYGTFHTDYNQRALTFIVNRVLPNEFSPTFTHGGGRTIRRSHGWIAPTRNTNPRSCI